MKFFLIIALFITMPAYAIEYIQSFKKVKYTPNFNLEKELIKNNCTKLDIQKSIFEQNNKITAKTKYVKVQTCYQDQIFTDEELSITNWEALKVPKGFILSKKIEENDCKNIYTKQIPHFYLKNKKNPKDVNIIKRGSFIAIQSCKSPIITPLIPENDIVVESESSADLDPLPNTNQKKQSYKLYGEYKRENSKSILGLGYKNHWMDSSILFGKKYLNLDLNPSILSTSIFSLEGYVGYQNIYNNTDLYANLGIDVNLGKLTAQGIFDYKKQGSFLGLSYQLSNPINTQIFYYQRQIGFAVKYYFNY